MPPETNVIHQGIITLQASIPEIRTLAAYVADRDDHEFALRFLTAGLATYPDDVFLLVEAGICLCELKRTPDAIPLLQRASDLDTTGKASIELAWAANEIKDYPTARQALTHALECNPHHLFELNLDTDGWTTIRYEEDVMRAIEKAEGKIAREHDHETTCDCDRSR